MWFAAGFDASLRNVNFKKKKSKCIVSTHKEK